MSNLLCICIPTYNRADKLDATLNYLLPYCRQYEVSICISDNCSTDSTQDVVLKYQDAYPFIQYKLCEYNIGPDRNFEHVLKMSECDYSWLLGDDDVILFNEFPSVLELLVKSSPDFLVVNTRNQVKENLPDLYTDKNRLLQDLGWHMSFISSLVFSKKCVESARFSDFYGTGFVHAGAALSYLGEKDEIDVRWLDKILVTTLRTNNQLPSWYNDLLYVFGEKWLNTIISLPTQYTAESKIIAARNLWVKSSIISMKALLLLRVYGRMNLSEVKKYHNSLSVLTGKKIVLVYIIAIIPRILISRPLAFVFNVYMKKRKKESMIIANKVVK